MGLTRRTIELAAPRHRGRLVAGVAFAVITVAAAVLVGRRLTQASWPLDNAQPALVVAAALSYLASYFFRARGWHRLFPPEECPDQARCLASVGAAAASGAVLPFRLDYLIKVGMLRKLGGVRVGLRGDRSVDRLAGDDRRDRDAATLDLGNCDERLRAPGPTPDRRRLRRRLLHAARRRRTLDPSSAPTQEPPPAGDQRSRRLAHDHPGASRRNRRLVLLARLLVDARFRQRRPAHRARAFVLADDRAFRDLLAAAAGVVPITSGGVVVGAGATAGILLALGVGKDIAINFSLASGLLLVGSAGRPPSWAFSLRLPSGQWPSTSSRAPESCSARSPHRTCAHDPVLDWQAFAPASTPIGAGTISGAEGVRRVQKRQPDGGAFSARSRGTFRGSVAGLGRRRRRGPAPAAKKRPAETGLLCRAWNVTAVLVTLSSSCPRSGPCRCRSRPCRCRSGSGAASRPRAS